MDYSQLMDYAVSKIECLPNNSEFLLKDLFDGTDWNSISKGDRIGLGKYFKNKVTKGNVPDVVFIGKAPNNSARYLKKSH